MNFVSVNALETQAQKVVCEFCGKAATDQPYLGKRLCSECIAGIDNEVDRLIDEAEAEEFFNDLDY